MYTQHFTQKKQGNLFSNGYLFSFLKNKILPLFTFLLFFSSFSYDAFASHYRGGSITWTNTGVNQATITVRQTWRLVGSGVANIGDIYNGGTLEFGDANSVPLVITADQINVAEDWFTGTFTVVHNYAGVGPFTPFYQSGNRIAALQNNANGFFRVESLINFVPPNNSPTSAMPMIVSMLAGQLAATLPVIAADPDGDVLTYSLATPGQMAGGTNPPGLVIDPNTGVITFNTAAALAGQLFSTSIVITDSKGAFIMRDLVLRMVSMPPTFTGLTPAEGAILTVCAGNMVTFTVEATDPEGLNLDMSQVGAPVGATFVPILPQVVVSPATTTFSWSPLLADVGNHVITFTVFDPDFNTITRTVNINVVCSPTSIILAAAPAEAHVTCMGDVPVPVNLNASINCNASVVSIVPTDVISPGICANKKTITRTWTATDQCNTTATIQIITANDNVSPVYIGSPLDMTVTCMSDVPPPAILQASNNCGETNSTATSADVTTAVICMNKKTITRTWTATDDCLNTAQTTQVITVNDNIMPILVAPANVVVSCFSDVPTAATLFATNNCGEANVLATSADLESAVVCANKKVITRTWTATDICGNVGTTSQVITVDDTILPTFDAACATTTILTTSSGATCPAGAVTNLTVGQIVSTTFQPIIATLTQSSLAGCLHDNCTADADMRAVVESINDDNGTCPRTIVVNYRILDICDNASDGLLSRTYIIIDNTKPTFVAICQSTFNFSTNASAICPGIADVSLSVNDVINVSQTWTAAGRTIPGVPGCWKDNCTSDANMRATVESIAITGDACNKTFVVSFRLLDVCGNTSTTLFATTINVTDDTKPTFDAACATTTNLTTNGAAICPASATTNLSVGQTVSTTFQPIIAGLTQASLAGCLHDNCTADANMRARVESINDDNGICPRTIVVNYRILDICNNTSVGLLSRTYIITDNTKPTFDVSCQMTFNYRTSGTINNYGQNSGGAICPASATINLNIGDIVSVSNTPLIAGILAPDLEGCFHDNCTSDANMRAKVIDISNTFNGCTRTIVISYHSLDQCGNESTNLFTCTFIITDDTKPTFVALCQSTFNFSTNAGATCPANASVSLAVNDIVNANQTWTAAGRTIPGVLGCWKDNCTSDANMRATVESIAITGDACNKTFVVGFRLLDVCGNTSTGLFLTTINVKDDTKPLFTYFPPNVTVNCHEVPVPANPTGTDNCDPKPTIVYVGESRIDGSCPYNYRLIRTWSITDVCGNQTLRAQGINVIDTIKPVFVPIADEVFNCKGTPALLVRFVSDNCSKSDKIKIDYNGEIRTNLSCPDNYTLLRKWTATDECKNATTVTQLNTVIDKQAPTLVSLPPMTTITCSAIPNPLPPKVEDKFSDAADIKISLKETDCIMGQCPIKHTLRHHWEATDLCGNKSIFQTFTQVRITQPPTFVNVPKNIAIGQKPIPGMFMPQAINECGDNVGVMWLGDVTATGSCPGSKIITRTWRAIDPCGGFSTTASQIITTGDNNPPVFTSAPLQTIYINYADLAKYPKPTLTATDDCGTPVITGPIETNNKQCNNGVAEVNWTWTATDQTGNTTTTSQNLVINDAMPSVKVTAPTIVVMNVKDQYLTANVTGGAPPYKYQWLGTNNVWDVLGISGNKINIFPNKQKGEFNVIVTDSRGCKGTTLFSKEAIPWCPMMCTLADTFYTNPKDTIKGGKTSIQLMETLLGYDTDGDGNADPLKLGNGKKSFVVTSDGVKCLGKILPSTSGLVSVLKDSTYLKKDTVCNFGTIKLTNGKVTNPLLVQMITLGMNLRYEPKLGYAPLKTLCSNVKLDTFSKKHINDIPRKDTTKTVKALFDYANLVMSGAFPKLSDKQIDSLYKAIKGVNDCFDGCKNLDLLAEDRSFSEEGLVGKIYLNQSHLRWTKRSTEFIHKFETEYSVDNQHFTLLETKINTDKRATAHAFDLIHKRPIQGVNYYRVKQYYEDGNIAYSNTVALDFKHNPIEVSLMPNPATDVFYLTLRAFENQKSPADIYICNELGIEMIYKHLDKITAEPIEFSTENLVNGIYFIRVMMDTEVIAGKKLVITKE